MPTHRQLAAPSPVEHQVAAGIMSEVASQPLLVRVSLALSPANSKPALLCVRLLQLLLLVALTLVHTRSIRVFRWEACVSGSIIVTYLISVVGMILGAGIENCGGLFFQAYMTASGGFMFVLNALVLLVRWASADQLTRAVTELLSVMGMRIHTQMVVKIALSFFISALMFLDALLFPLVTNTVQGAPYRSIGIANAANITERV